MYRQLEGDTEEILESFLVFFFFLREFLRNPDTFVTFDSIWQRAKLFSQWHKIPYRRHTILLLAHVLLNSESVC